MDEAEAAEVALSLHADDDRANRALAGGALAEVPLVENGFGVMGHGLREHARAHVHLARRALRAAAGAAARAGHDDRIDLTRARITVRGVRFVLGVALVIAEVVQSEQHSADRQEYGEELPHSLFPFCGRATVVRKKVRTTVAAYIVHGMRAIVKRSSSVMMLLILNQAKINALSCKQGRKGSARPLRGSEAGVAQGGILPFVKSNMKTRTVDGAGGLRMARSSLRARAGGALGKEHRGVFVRGEAGISFLPTIETRTTDDARDAVEARMGALT